MEAPTKTNEVVVVNDKKFSLTELGYNSNDWLALKNTLFPGISDASAMNYLRLCKARKLDPMKKPFAVIGFNRKNDRGDWEKVETIIPTVNDQRTTAMRTGQYAGCDDCAFGPDATHTFTGVKRGYNGKPDEQLSATLTFPEWAQMTVYRMLNGQRVPFVGPKVRFMEAYGADRSGFPNEQWVKRPFGMLEKCAEAAALRRAFPEELGNEPSAEEMEGIDHREMRVVSTPADAPAQAKAADLAAAVGLAKAASEPVMTAAVNDNGQVIEAEVVEASKPASKRKAKAAEPAPAQEAAPADNIGGADDWGQ